MLEYDRSDISEGINVNKSNDNSKERGICHYWYFLDKNFSYQPHLRNGFHDLMQKAMSFNDVAIVSIKGSDYRIHFWYMSKDDAISIMHNSNLINKRGALQFFLTYKIGGTTYYERNRDVILNAAKKRKGKKQIQRIT